MTASELTELAARVEAGSGQDIDLREAIAKEFGYTIGTEPYYWAPPGHPGQHHHYDLPAWEDSLDATVALIAERLLGWDHEYHVTFVDGPPVSRALVYNRDYQCGGGLDGVFPARALLAATLRALAAQQQDRQTEGDSSNG